MFSVTYVTQLLLADNVKCHDNKLLTLWLDINDEEQRGTSYIRWGRKTCQSNATLVYQGAVIHCIRLTEIAHMQHAQCAKDLHLWVNRIS